MASQKVCSGLRNLSRENIDTVLAEDIIQFKPPAIPPSAFQQARCRAFHRSVLLGHSTIFGYKKNDGLQDSARASCPCGEGRIGREKPKSYLHTCMEGKVI